MCCDTLTATDVLLLQGLKTVSKLNYGWSTTNKNNGLKTNTDMREHLSPHEFSLKQQNTTH